MSLKIRGNGLTETTICFKKDAQTSSASILFIYPTTCCSKIKQSKQLMCQVHATGTTLQFLSEKNGPHKFFDKKSYQVVKIC